MATSYTTSLRLALPVTGELDGTWGDTVNQSITSMVEQAVAGYTSVAMSDADKTLSTANGATDESRNMYIKMTGTLTTARNVVVPSVSKLYHIKNSTTGGFAITVKTSAGAGVSIPNGYTAELFCDGTNVIAGIDSINGDVVTLNTATQTLTNKTLTSPVLTTPSLGVATATSINKLTITPPATAATLTINNGKSLSVVNSMTLASTVEAMTITFQGTDTYVGRDTTDTLTNKTLTGATLTGSAFNGTVGATTPSTGAFTTLSASGNSIVGGGTAVSGGGRTYLTLGGNALGSMAFKNAADAVVGYALSSSTGLDILANTGGSLGLGANGAVVATVSSTGLAVTGALSASGVLTVTGDNNVTSIGGTQHSIVKAGDTNNDYAIRGFQTSAGGTIAVLAAKATTTGVYPSSVGELHIGVQNGGSTVDVATFSSTGLAVTGATTSSTYGTFGTTGQLGGGVLGGQFAAATGNGLVLKDTSTTYAYNNNYLVLQNSGGAVVGSIGHDAANTFNLNAPNGMSWTLGSTTKAMTFSSTGLSLANVGQTPLTLAGDANAVWSYYDHAGTADKYKVGIVNSKGGLCVYNSTDSRYEMEFDGAGNVSIPNGNLSVTGRISASDTATLSKAGLALDISGGASAYMRFTGTSNVTLQNVGSALETAIGGTTRTSVSATGLAVTGGISATNTTAGGITLKRTDAVNANQWLNFTGSDDVVDGSVRMATDAANALTFWTAAAERARIDASGNLGLGVTPSAWGSSKAIEVGYSGSALASLASTDIRLFGNAYYNGTNYKYSSTNLASMYVQNSGIHYWYNAASGTAGNNITFTQAMTLDASGNLGLGGAAGFAGNRRGLSIQSGYAAGALEISGTAAATEIGNNLYYNGSAYVTRAAGYSSLWTFNNDVTGGWAFKLGASTSAGATPTLTQAMTLDASGNLLVGLTTASATPSQGVAIYGNNGGSSLVAIGHASGTASGNYYAGFAYNGAAIGSITQSGTTAVAYNTTSDHRLKTNIRPANATRFNDIEFVDFEWIDGRHDCGVIAHELQAVYPDLVIGEKDAVEIRQVEISPAIAAVTEQVLVTEAVINDEGEEIEPAVYETVEVTPAVEAIFEDQEFPVYQQVNFMGLIGRMGTRIQIQDKAITAQSELIARLEERLSKLENK